jgi:hypothetical protein
MISMDCGPAAAMTAFSKTPQTVTIVSKVVTMSANQWTYTNFDHDDGKQGKSMSGVLGRVAKWTILIVAVCAVAAFVIGIIVTHERPVIEKADTGVVLTEVLYRNRDITADIDKAAALKLLEDVRCRKSLFDNPAYPIKTANVDWEINMVDAEGRPIHIVLGVDNFVYETVPKFYKLIDYNRLLHFLNVSIESVEQ